MDSPQPLRYMESELDKKQMIIFTFLTINWAI